MENARFDLSVFPEQIKELTDANTNKIIEYHYCVGYNSGDGEDMVDHISKATQARFGWGYKK